MNHDEAPAQPEPSISAQEVHTDSVVQPDTAIQQPNLQQAEPIEAPAVTKDVYVVNQPLELRSQQLVELPNGDFIAFSNEMTLGDALVSAGLFLILAFLVLQWLLKLSTGRG
ncbi:hypothetical protein HFE03_25890 [Paenibacillus sp. EKM102P]|uniref:hypothetical protein n=1 Tax=unclassified Paenibacillus TaxID=185978 RepID=UPI00142DC307|nr:MULTISPECIES: hypothetical protein [unclassified Paenibacillus]KAF6614211.1 hypothetical protein HFE00_25815 [Paenibacillus sp. EKM101P]KAF6616590.1 hypothetical protein HFE03_25890 [Paenibacillus sp. EKM102P]KAF6625036.1 hypothetical protein HFE01_26000 [Paenibacillus sp. EKM10P]KAF6640882.1 hypothetical protein HFE02_25905 [Paenibacillus sp. EKM11P]